jgi:hypothetical protein
MLLLVLNASLCISLMGELYVLQLSRRKEWDLKFYSGKVVEAIDDHSDVRNMCESVCLSV